MINVVSVVSMSIIPLKAQNLLLFFVKSGRLTMDKKGFTLIELLIVIAIIGLLAALTSRLDV